jgi:uncharacterized protein YegP (UPF0339 family)
MYFEMYPTTYGLRREWRWRLKGANHEIIASGEGYTSKQGCLHAINLLKGTTLLTPVREVLS